MSVRTLARVWADSQHAGTSLLMLLAIADFADDDGRAYPSVAGLADKCRMKPRNANYILAELQASGELRVLRNGGPRGKNLYQIVFSAMKPGREETAQGGAGVAANARAQANAGVQRDAGLQASVATPAPQCAKPLHPSAPEPSLNRQEPSLFTEPSGSGTAGPNAADGSSRSHAPKPAAKSQPAWEAYAAAFQKRYGVHPTRDAAVNSQLARLVDKVGAVEAPKLAAFYVQHDGAFYAQQVHPANLLLKDADKLRVEMLTGLRVPTAGHRRADAGSFVDVDYTAGVPR